MVTQNTVDTELDLNAEEPTKEPETLTTEAVPDVAALQQQLSESQAKIAKLENDLKSRDGQRRKQSETDGILLELQAEVRAQRKVLSLYLDSVQSGDTDGLAEKRAGVDRESEQERARRRFQTRYDATSDKLLDVVQPLGPDGKRGELLLTEAQANEIQEAWKKAGAEAYQTGDFGSLTEVIVDAVKMVGVNHARRIQQEEKTKTKQRLAKAGVIDLDTGPSAGGSGVGMSWAQAQKIKKASELSDAAYEKLVAGG